MEDGKRAFGEIWEGVKGVVEGVVEWVLFTLYYFYLNEVELDFELLLTFFFPPFQR